jgi:hypothetical protein
MTSWGGSATLHGNPFRFTHCSIPYMVNDHVG